jgi:ubiquinone/menaquinone biosynthesis C-methylase UbiE
MKSTSDWQHWDEPGVADWIESYWQGSLHESAQRQVVANLCARLLGSRTTSFLEVGCGTGLVYERLVPTLLEADSYTGVDISERMLAFAHAKFPQGRFLKGSGYELAFPDRNFEVAAAFEVVIHVPDLGGFVRELYRVARRMAVFSVWVSPREALEDGRTQICGTTFINRRFSHEYVMSEIRRALPTADVAVEVAVLRVDCWAYLLTPGAVGSGIQLAGISSVPGYTEHMLAGLQRRGEDGGSG